MADVIKTGLPFEIVGEEKPGDKKGRPRLLETEFQQEVIEYAQGNGFIVAHFRPARILRDGIEVWVTPVAADGKGFMDLVFARSGTMIAAELKVYPNKPTEEQEKWIRESGAYLWYPEDWDTIRQVLAQE